MPANSVFDLWENAAMRTTNTHRNNKAVKNVHQVLP